MGSGQNFNLETGKKVLTWYPKYFLPLTPTAYADILKASIAFLWSFLGPSFIVEGVLDVQKPGG